MTKMKINLKFLIILLVFTIFGVQAIKAQSLRDKQIAKYLFDFGLYLRWQNDYNIEIIKIGVLNETPTFINELKRITKNGYDNVIMIEVINFKTTTEIKETHMLFVPKAQNSQITNILRKITGYNTALVTEEYEVKKDLMINFIKRGDNYTFEMNVDNLKEMNVGFHPEISRLNGTIISAKALIDESEKNLELEKRKVKSQLATIKKQQDQIDQQKINIDRQQKELDSQKALLLNQADEIVQQENRLKGQRAELIKLENEAKTTRLELENKTKDLAIKEASIKEQESRIASQTKVLKDLEDDISERQKKIDKQNLEIVAQSGTIRAQNNILLIFFIFSITVLVLLFFILRGYRIKKKDNILLEKQKHEIEKQALELESINKELEKLSIVASETSTAVIILDTKGNFEWINYGFTKLYGYTIEMLREVLSDNIYRASNHPDIENLVNTCIHEKRPVIYEAFVSTLSGENKWAQSTLTPILDKNGNVSKLVLIDSDISKIKEAENEIIIKNQQITMQAMELEKKNAELEKLSLVASKTDNSVIIANADGEIEWVNDGFTRLLGVSFEEFASEYGHNMFKSSLNPRLREQLDTAIREKRSIIYSAKTTTKDGRFIWIQTTMTPIFDPHGELSKYIAIDADITKIKLAEEEISRQKQKITDSIFYAKKIQEAVLPPADYLHKLLPEHFIMYKPKDIVSGDFYWASHKGDKIMIAAADCTGHGVPGGFMSMLGMTFLNEITGKLSENELIPGQILTMLRDSVKNSLRQTGKEGETKDGMDINLIVLDRRTLQLQYAGANSPLLILRDNGEELEVINVKADEMPIGIFYNEKAQFANHRIQLRPGDLCYLFSDGFSDQFGGKAGRKFMAKRFKNMIAMHSEKSMKDQKLVFERAFDVWKGEHRQIDDVLVIGIRVAG
jgi:PAS domain S-box-containing protein